MNKKQAHKLAKLAEDRFDIIEFLGTPGDGYAVSCNGRIFYTLEQFYRAFPQSHKPYATQKRGDKWVVVFVEDEDDNRVRDIDGARLYPQRQGANRRALQLNNEWRADREAESYA